MSMKKVLLIILLFLFPFLLFSQGKQDTLTNRKIINMVKAGISEMLIKKTITSTKYWRFDLSSDSIIVLKSNKVSDTIIVAMFDKESAVPLSTNQNQPINPPPAKQPTSTVSETNKSLSELSPGIYYESTNKGTVEYSRLNANIPSQNFKSDPIIGITNKIEYSFFGKQALTRIKTNSPVFYLVVGTSYENVVYQPTLFVVVNAVEKKGNRIIYGKTVVASSKLFELDKKYVITPTFTKLSETLYKITFEKKLPFGHYFFGPPRIGGSSYLEFDIL